MRDFNWFLYKVNQRACINLGYIDEEYQSLNRDGKEDYGLGKDVEYFHPTITLDDRMRYIAQNIAQADMSHFNILSNTIISHFYGARGVHQTVTGSDDPNDCFVDFDRIVDGDTDLVERHRKIIDYQSKVNKKPIWGTTELHTSIQTGARNYCRQKSANPQREFHPVDVLEWITGHVFSKRVEFRPLTGCSKCGSTCVHFRCTGAKEGFLNLFDLWKNHDIGMVVNVHVFHTEVERVAHTQ